MKNTITVWFRGSGVLVSKAVAKSLKISDGYFIKSESEFWKILKANASYNMSLCEAKINIRNSQN